MKFSAGVAIALIGFQGFAVNGARLKGKGAYPKDSLARHRRLKDSKDGEADAITPMCMSMSVSMSLSMSMGDSMSMSMGESMSMSMGASMSTSMSVGDESDDLVELATTSATEAATDTTEAADQTTVASAETTTAGIDDVEESMSASMSMSMSMSTPATTPATTTEAAVETTEASEDTTTTGATTTEAAAETTEASTETTSAAEEDDDEGTSMSMTTSMSMSASMSVSMSMSASISMSTSMSMGDSATVDSLGSKAAKQRTYKIFAEGKKKVCKPQTLRELWCGDAAAEEWTSLGLDGLPDQAIEDGLKQPDRFKISFTVNGKELSRSAVPDQACFSPEFFLAQTLPDFESKIVLCLPVNKQRDRPTLFPLMEQCSKEVGLIESTNFVSTRCPEDESKMFENLVKCQQDYLKALVGFPNIGDWLIRWFCTAQKPALMPMHDCMHHRVQLMSYLKKDLLCATMELPSKKGPDQADIFLDAKETSAEVCRGSITRSMLRRIKLCRMITSHSSASSSSAKTLIKRTVFSTSSKRRRRKGPQRNRVPRHHANAAPR
eukprot:CCRYP_004461-RB/>CCRYP_004461-RB protein AED:0.46 eAED:0.46 QI:457/0.66/0.57/0.71/0.5/0.42/7/0/551